MARHKNPFSVRPLRKRSTFQERLARLRKVRHGLLVVALVLLGIGSAMTFRSAEAVDIQLPSATPSVSGAPIAPAAFDIDAPQSPAVEPDAASGVTPTLSGGNLRGYVFNQAPDDTTAEQSPLQLYDYTNTWGRLNVINGIWNTGSAAGGGSGSNGPTLTVTAPPAEPPADAMPATATVTPPWIGVVFRSTIAASGGNVTINSITVNKSGNLNAGSIHVGSESGGVFTSWGNTSISTSTGPITFSNLNTLILAGGAPVKLAVRLSISSGATPQSTVQIGLPSFTASPQAGQTGTVTVSVTQGIIGNIFTVAAAAPPPATPPSVTVSNYCGATGTLTPLTNNQTIGCLRLAVTNGPLNLTSIKFTYSGTLPKERISNLRLQNGAGANLATAASIANDNTVLFTCGASCGLNNGNNDLKVIADIGNACMLIEQAASLSYGNVTLRLDVGNLSSNASGTNPATTSAFSTYTVTIPNTSPNICTAREVHVDGRPIPTATTVTPGTRMLACWRVWAHGANYPTTITQIILGRIGTMSVNNLVLRNAPPPAAGQAECSGAGATNINTPVVPSGPYSSDGNITFTTNWTLGPADAGSDDIHYLVLLGNVLSGTSGRNIYFLIQNPATVSGSLVTREPATFSATSTWPEKSHTSQQGVLLAAGDASRMTAENDLTQSLQANVLGDFGRSVAGVLIPPVYAQTIASYGTPPASLTSFAGELTAASFPNPVRIFDDMIIQGNSDSENGRLDLHGVIVNTQAASGGGTHPVTVADNLWVKGNIRVDGASQFTGNLATEGDLTTTDNLIVGGTATIIGATTILGNINVAGSVSSPLRLANTTLSDSSDGRLTVADSVLIQGGDNDALVISRASGETDLTLQSGSSAWQLGTGDADIGSSAGFYLANNDQVRLTIRNTASGTPLTNLTGNFDVTGKIRADRIGHFYKTHRDATASSGTYINSEASCLSGDFRIACSGYQDGSVSYYKGSWPDGSLTCKGSSIRNSNTTSALHVWAHCFSPDGQTAVAEGTKTTYGTGTVISGITVDGLSYSATAENTGLRIEDRIMTATPVDPLIDILGPLINPIPPGGF